MQAPTLKSEKQRQKTPFPVLQEPLKKVNPGALNHPQKKLGASDDTTTIETIYGRKTRKPDDQFKEEIKKLG